MATEERTMGIAALRDNLAWACKSVAETDEPIIVQRYARRDVAIVPLWEWRFLKEIEAAIRAGKCPWEDGMETSK